MNADTHPPFDAQPMAWAARRLIWFCTPMMLLDIGMLIVSILAYTGAHMEEDSEAIKKTFITFPTSGHHIQRLEIALSALGIIVHCTFGFWLMVRVGRFCNKVNHDNGHRLKMALLCATIPWALCSLAAWICCVVFQASYVPLIPRYSLPECWYYGDKLGQCDMVSATWVFAMVYCVLSAGMLGFALLTLYRLKYPTAEQDADENANRIRPSRKVEPPPPYRSRPPSYRSNTSSRPPSYHSDLPRARWGEHATMATLPE